MAGPKTTNRGGTVTFPTWPFSGTTELKIENESSSDCSVEVQAGIHPSETHHISGGDTLDATRNFGGAPVNVKCTSGGPIKVWTK